MKVLLACLLCFVGGGVVGYFLSGGDLDEGQKERQGHQEAGRRSGDDQRSGQSSPDVISSRDLSSASGLSEPPEDGGFVVVSKELIGQLSQAAGKRSAGMSLFSKDGKLEKLLQIGDQEKAEIQTAWRDSLQKIRDLEMTASKTEDLEDGSVKITVPDLLVEMSLLGEEFQSSVEETLGENRGGVFLAAKQVDQVFASSPGDRTYGVKVEAAGDGRWRYHMTLSGPAGRKVWVSEKIPDEIRHLTDAARILPQIENQPEVEDDCH